MVDGKEFESLGAWLNTAEPRSLYCGPLRVGEWFQGKYQIEAVLGYGHTSIVFKATDTRLGRPVALKLWNDTQSGITSAVLLKEGRLLAQLQHPNIVKVYDYGIEDVSARPWMALEFLGVTTLYQVLRARQSFHADPARLVDISLQVSSIVDYLHNSSNILQLDLKPGNLSFNEQTSHIKMMDLGSAHLQTDSSHERLGTPGYIAPELFQQGEVTKAVDVFSLGMLLFELATGENPLITLQRDALKLVEEGDSSWGAITAAIPIEGRGRVGWRGYMRLAGDMQGLDFSSALANLALPFGFQSLILDCIQMNPMQRPSVHDIWLRLNQMQRPADQSGLPSVFLSHSHKDKNTFVKQFAEYLRAKGFTVWLDEWNIRVGEPFWERIFKGIEDSNFVIIILSANSVASVGVAEELRTAQLENLKKVKILPIRIDPVEYSEIPPHLRSRQIFDLVGWEKPDVFYKKVDKLAAEIISVFESQRDNN